MDDLFTQFPVLLTDFLLILKAFYLLGLFMYVVFAAFVVRQVDMMQSSLQGLLGLPIKPIALLHLLASVIILLMAAFVL